MKDYNYGKGLNKDTFGEELSRIRRERSEYYKYDFTIDETTISTPNMEEITMESSSDSIYNGRVQKSTLADFKRRLSSEKKFKPEAWIVVIMIIAFMGNSIFTEVRENVKTIIQEFNPNKSQIISHEGTENGTPDEPNRYAKKVWFEGEELQLPCKMSELPEDFKLAMNAQDILDEIDESGISYFVSLYYHGDYASVHLNLKNLSGKEITNIGDLDIVKVYESDHRYGQVKFYRGIKIGMKTETLENALKNITYTVYKDPEYTSYSFYLYADSEVQYDVNIENGVVSSVSVTASEEYE